MPADLSSQNRPGSGGGGGAGRGKGGICFFNTNLHGLCKNTAYWTGDVALEYRKILLAGAGERAEERVEQSGAMKRIVKRKGLSQKQLDAEKQRLLEAGDKRMGEIPFGRMLRCRMRYFTDGPS